MSQFRARTRVVRGARRRAVRNRSAAHQGLAEGHGRVRGGAVLGRPAQKLVAAADPQSTERGNEEIDGDWSPVKRKGEDGVVGL